MALFPQAWASQGIQLVLGEMEAREPVCLVFFLLWFVGMSNGLQGLLRNTVEIAWRTSVHLSPDLSSSLMPSSVAPIPLLSALHFTGSLKQMPGSISQTPGSFHRLLLFPVKLSRCTHRCPCELHTSSVLRLCLLHGSASTGWNNTCRQLRADPTPWCQSVQTF